MKVNATKRAVSVSIFLLFVAVIVLTRCQNPTGISGIPDQVDFNFHIRPILSDKCFACHGPDANKREQGLRLDTREGALAVLKDYNDRHAIVPGKVRGV